MSAIKGHAAPASGIAGRVSQSADCDCAVGTERPRGGHGADDVRRRHDLVRAHAVWELRRCGRLTFFPLHGTVPGRSGHIKLSRDYGGSGSRCYFGRVGKFDRNWANPFP